MGCGLLLLRDYYYYVKYDVIIIFQLYKYADLSGHRYSRKLEWYTKNYIKLAWKNFLITVGKLHGVQKKICSEQNVFLL